MIGAEMLRKAEEFVKENIKNEYTWVHTQAVRKIAKKFIETDGGDADVIDLAVLFHDIERGKSGMLQHAEAGAEVTRKFMTETGFDKELIEKVVHCVASHSTPWAKTGPGPATHEAKIVFDADMVQQISPFGIIKHIHEFNDVDFEGMMEKLEKTITEMIPAFVFTDTAKEMVQEQMPYVKDFIARARD